jgi:hypothetical protein
MFENGEIEQVIQVFERSRNNLPYTGGRLTKEPRENWKRQQYYQHGETNNQFLAFLAGYALGKHMHQS